jgi:hypothetical protein
LCNAFEVSLLFWMHFSHLVGPGDRAFENKLSLHLVCSLV